MSDKVLIEAAVAGDRDAIGRLLTEHAEDVRRTISIPFRYRSQLSADDVMQEAFIDAATKIHTFDPNRSFRAWLRTIADRNLKDFLRAMDCQIREGGHRRIDPVAGAGSEARMYEAVFGQWSATPSRFRRLEDAVEAMMISLRDLPEDHHRIVEAIDLRQQPVSAVADELGLSIGAVYMKRARALRAIGKVLGSRSRWI